MRQADRETTPYEKASVRALVRESGVNKSAFYRHSDGVADLARQPRPSPPSHPGFQDRLTRVRAIARAKGTPELQDMLKGAIAERWGAAVGFDPDELDPSASSRSTAASPCSPTMGQKRFPTLLRAT